MRIPRSPRTSVRGECHKSIGAGVKQRYEITSQHPDPVNPQHEDQVFLNADGYPITHEAAEKVFQRVKKAVGVAKFHPHACRHTFSVRYLMDDGDAFSLQKILGILLWKWPAGMLT
ncbi:MAG: tyrosine-type recombinase/integrase [Anaerolineales bacterium]